MTYLKDINLVDSYLNPAKLRFFTTEACPNGTSDLIIVDDMGQIVDYLDNMLFNPIIDHDRNGNMLGDINICYYGDSIGSIPSDIYETSSDCPMVYPLLLEDVLESIAVSPVHTKFSQLRLLISSIKESAA